jgi:agmatinase
VGPEVIPSDLYPYVGVQTFLRAPLADTAEGADIALLGVPFDEGSPFVPGSRFGPRAIRTQSLRFAGGMFDLRSERAGFSSGDPGRRIVDVGDVTVLPATPEHSARNITAAVQRVLGAGALPVVLGGDHSITFPVIRAFEGPLYVVQFDAHLDYIKSVDAYRFTNQHAFPQISALDSVVQLFQVGVRSLRTSSAQYEDSIADGNRLVTPDEVDELGPRGIAELVPAGARCYVTIDIDALDHSLVPGCVSAEPGGLTYPQLRDALRELVQRVDVVGLDLVEVNPMVDNASGATAYLATHLLLETLDALTRQPVDA